MRTNLPKQLTEKPRLSAFSRFTLSASPEKVSAVTAGALAVISLLVLAVYNYIGSNNQLDTLSSTAIVTLSATMAIATAIGVFIGIKLQRNYLDKQLDIRTTAKDRIALHTWFKHGKKPTSRRLQPVLSKYIDYMEQLLNGQTIPLSNTARNFLLAILGLSLLSNVLTAIFKLELSTLRGFNIVIQTVLILMYLPSHGGKPNKLFKAMNSRSLLKVAAMRRQLQLQLPDICLDKVYVLRDERKNPSSANIAAATRLSYS